MRPFSSCAAITGWLAATYVAGGCSTASSTPVSAPAVDPDPDLAARILGLTSQLNNEYLSGRPSGPQNVGGSCPLGGTAAITGSDSVSQGIEAVALTFTFTGCESSEPSGGTLTLSGVLTMAGTFGSLGGPQSGSESLQYSASSLAIVGTNQGTETCPVSVNEQAGVGGSGAVSGAICGRAFSFPASSGAPSSSSGGGSGSGSGGTANGYSYANYDCKGSAQCISVMGHDTGSAGPFCSATTCSAWLAQYFAGGTCTPSPVYTITNASPAGTCT